MRRETRHIQMVFQDPFGSLNPRRKVGELVAQGPIVHGMDRTQALREAPSELFGLRRARPGSAPTAIRTSSPAASASASASPAH